MFTREILKAGGSLEWRTSRHLAIVNNKQAFKFVANTYTGSVPRSGVPLAKVISKSVASSLISCVISDFGFLCKILNR